MSMQKLQTVSFYRAVSRMVFGFVITGRSMAFNKTVYRLIFYLCWIASVPFYAQAQETTLYQSVEQALSFSPQLQALVYSNEAIEYDLKRARAGYRPSINLLLGYGAGQHSDSVTRLPGADPSDSEWNSRGDATLRLIQKVYDGGETSQTVSIQRAILESADYGLQEATLAISLNAISAHLDVYRQRELVALAEKDLQVHQDIYRALSDIEQAGYGNIADVTQTQTRMLRAQSVLIISQSDLCRAISNYERMVGVKPGELAFAKLPNTMPGSLDDALTWAEQKNPGLIALNARVLEAEARVDLARSAYKPKVNVELSSRYHDQLEGDPSWQHTNDAMLVMRWNLYKGGQDKQATNAALSRKYQSRSNRDDKLIELRESTAIAWADYLSLQSQKIAYREAVDSSNKTFDAYMKQYSVSRRSLLDVLNAEKEYFQSARQLVSASVDEIITAYRIMSLGGELQVAETTGVGEIPTDLSRLSQAIVLPAAVQSYRAESRTAQSHQTQGTGSDSVGTKDHTAPAKRPDTRSVANAGLLNSIEIGPCNKERVMAQAIDRLQDLGFDAQSTLCTSRVKVTRLLEGRYIPESAYVRLETIRKSVDAFVLPEGDKLAIYVGSFHNYEEAIRYAQLLAEKNIEVTPIAAEIDMQGKMLIVQQVDRLSAEKISEQMSELGLTTNTVTSGS